METQKERLYMLFTILDLELELISIRIIAALIKDSKSA